MDTTPEDVTPLCLAVTLTIRAGAEAQAEACLRALSAATRTEAGCLIYNVHRSLQNPREFIIYELYCDPASLQAHRESEHFARYAEGELHALAEARQAVLHAPVSVAPVTRAS